MQSSNHWVSASVGKTSPFLSLSFLVKHLSPLSVLRPVISFPCRSILKYLQSTRNERGPKLQPSSLLPPNAPPARMCRPRPRVGWLMVADAVPDCKEIEELLGGRVSRPFRSGFGLCPGTNSRKASFDGFLRRIWWCFCSREICCWSNGLDASLSRMLGQMHCVGLELSRVA